MKYKGHYNQFFNCLYCNERTDIMLDSCITCGSRTPVDQKDYRRMRTRKLNAILISKYEKNLNQLKKLSRDYPYKIKFSKNTFIDRIKFKVGNYKGRLKHLLNLY
tara:strand:+ start:406 stop:720 length:315 start_codon:yes stop_codon:yes gene_type:complete